MPNNTLAARSNKTSFSVYMTNDAVKQQISNVVGKNADKFITAITSAVNANPALSECTNSSIVSAALLGTSLNLSPSPQLGQFYLVPFNDNVNHRKAAQFILGYKGYIQLALRSGQYKKLNVLSIKEGELVKYDPLNEDIDVHLIEDEEEREKAPTIGYFAMFEYLNGFRKTMYWSRTKMEAHARKYSKGYAAHKGYTFWEKDFDGMAYKTMLRQLISKWGIMSIEMASAIDADMSVVNSDGTKDYVEMEEVPEGVVEAPAQEVKDSQDTKEEKEEAVNPAAALFK